MTGTPSFLKCVNQDKILTFLRLNGTATKPQIAAATGISLVTVTKLVNTLLEEKKLISCGTEDSTGGRKALRFKINPDSSYALAIYYEHDSFEGFVIDAVGQIAFQKKYPADGQETEQLYGQICNALDHLLLNCVGRKVEVIGVGMPGVVNHGILTSIPSLDAWEGFPLTKRLEEDYHLPVLMENDMNLAAMGIYTSLYEEDYQDMLLIYLDEGVGAGIILNGELFCGKTKFAGELGFLPVSMPCVRNETKNPESERLEHAISRIRTQYDTYGRTANLCDTLCDVLAQAVVCVVGLLNPEVIVLKSSILRETDLSQITTAVETVVGVNNTPEFTLLTDIREFCVQGMIKICMEYRDYAEKEEVNL